ncbi:MAG: hypothetical protein HQK89_15785, partial [Nitrospirae bacterium]|nr:hypothetical protein [Nitrospirota bacterium]
MVNFDTGNRPEEVSDKHVLFVEGESEESVDPEIITELFDEMIEVKPLGSSYSIKSVAQALYKYHPTYYFLIDR